MTSRQRVYLTKLSQIRSNAMDFFDWLIVLFSFAIALYLMFSSGGTGTDWPTLTPSQGDDEGRLG